MDPTTQAVEATCAEPRKWLPGIVRLIAFAQLSYNGDRYITAIDNGRLLDAIAAFALAVRGWLPLQLMSTALLGTLALMVMKKWATLQSLWIYAIPVLAVLIFNLRRFSRILFVNSFAGFAANDLARRRRDLVSNDVLARHILHECTSSSKPFVLFLRDFKLDAVTISFSRDSVPDHIAQTLRSETQARKAVFGEDADTFLIRSANAGAGEDERIFASVAHNYAPVIGVWNRSSFMHDLADTCVRRLVIDEDEWQQDISALIIAARCICILANSAGPGLEFERSQLLRYGKESSTIIVACEPISDALGSIGLVNQRRDVNARVAFGSFTHIVSTDSSDRLTEFDAAIRNIFLRSDA